MNSGRNSEHAGPSAGRLVDFHLHSTFSPDSRVTMEEHCRNAIARSVSEVGFSEHLEFDPEDDGWGFFRYDEYKAEINRCRSLFDGRLLIRAGVEVTYQREYVRQIEKTLGQFELDHVIGSVHLVEGRNMTDKRFVGDYFEVRNADQAYGAYFRLLAEAAASGFFDILGHFDVAKRHGVLYYGPFRYHEMSHHVDPALEAAVKHGLAVEVNASGLRQYPDETYPSLDLLRRYRELGGTRVTIGSDGHVHKHGCWGLNRALDIVRRAGFDRLTVFEGRVPREISLPETDSSRGVDAETGTAV